MSEAKVSAATALPVRLSLVVRTAVVRKGRPRTSLQTSGTGQP